jgi:hypothetical protein
VKNTSNIRAYYTQAVEPGAEVFPVGHCEQELTAVPPGKLLKVLAGHGIGGFPIILLPITLEPEYCGSGVPEQGVFGLLVSDGPVPTGQ